MPNEPEKAKEKRPAPARRQNAQGDHEGSAHSPEEFKRGDETGAETHGPSTKKD